MRVAVFSDPHGNLEALDAILAAIDALAPDHVVCAGDIAQFGPQPNEAVERVRMRGIPCVRGNHDRDIVDPLPPTDDPRRAKLREIHNWGVDQLTPENRAFLLQLPFAWHVEPVPGQTLLVVHASPEKDDAIVEPRQMAPGTILSLAARAKAAAIVCGHLHRPFIAREGPALWVNAGSAGCATDGDNRASFALLTFDGRQWSGDIHRVPYDLEAAAAAILASGMPHAVELIASRAEARWL